MEAERPRRLERRLVAAVALFNLLSTLTSLYHWHLLLMHIMSAAPCWSSHKNHGKICKRKRSLRTCWIRPGRTDMWWNNFVNDTVLAKEWKENFRMCKANFFKLCNELRPFLQKKSTTMRQAISVEKQVVVTLYYLSDEGRLRKSANPATKSYKDLIRTCKMYQDTIRSIMM